MFSLWGQIKCQSILGMNTILFVVICVILYELIKWNIDIAKVVLFTTFVLILRQIFNNKIGRDQGIGTLPGFIKILLIFLGCCVVLIPELYSDNLFRTLLFLNLMIMITLCIADIKYQNGGWKYYPKLEILPLIGLVYLLTNFPKDLRMENGIIKSSSDINHWLVLQSVLLSYLYLNTSNFQHIQSNTLATAILPLMYPLGEYYNVRTVTLTMWLISYLSPKV